MLLEFADAVFFNIAFCKDLDRIPTRSIKHSLESTRDKALQQSADVDLPTRSNNEYS